MNAIDRNWLGNMTKGDILGQRDFIHSLLEIVV